MNEKENMDTKKTKIIKTVFETSGNQGQNPGSIKKIGTNAPSQIVGYAKVPQSEISQPNLPRAIEAFEPAKLSPQRAPEVSNSQQTSAAALKRQPSDAETHHKKPRQPSKVPGAGVLPMATKGKIYLTLQQRLQNYQQRHVEKVLKNEAHMGPSRAIKNIGGSPVRIGKRAETGFGRLGWKPKL